MNKTQINYFCDKIEAALRKIKNSCYSQEEDDEDIDTKFELTQEEKIGQILKGEARFKAELFECGSCPSYSGKMFDFFQFVGEDELLAKKLSYKKELETKLNKIEKEAKREAERLKDDFVLERLADPTKAINDYIARYIDESDDNQNVKKKKRMIY